MKIQMAQAVHYEQLIDSRIDPSMGPFERARAKAICRSEAKAMALVDVGAPPAVVSAERRRHQIMEKLNANPSMQDASSLDLLLEATKALMDERNRSGKDSKAIVDF